MKFFNVFLHFLLTLKTHIMTMYNPILHNWESVSNIIPHETDWRICFTFRKIYTLFKIHLGKMQIMQWLKFFCYKTFVELTSQQAFTCSKSAIETLGRYYTPIFNIYIIDFERVSVFWKTIFNKQKQIPGQLRSCSTRCMSSFNS